MGESVLREEYFTGHRKYSIHYYYGICNVYTETVKATQHLCVPTETERTFCWTLEHWWSYDESMHADI